MTHNLTFRQLESSEDRELVARSGTSPLETWYKAVRDKPIVKFSVEDLCRACRQQIFPEAVIPIAIERLSKEPLAGEMYDGELIVAMSNIAKAYWITHPSQAIEVTAIAQSIMPQVDDDLRRELARLVVLASPD